MKQIHIEDEHIKDFLRSLPLGAEGVALEVDGAAKSRKFRSNFSRRMWRHTDEEEGLAK